MVFWLYNKSLMLSIRMIQACVGTKIVKGRQVHRLVGSIQVDKLRFVFHGKYIVQSPAGAAKY